MILTKNQIFKAKLIAHPAKWNTFHYIVETDSICNAYKFLYFSEAAQGKPPVDTELNTEGIVKFDGVIFRWESISSKENKDITLEEWLKE